MWIEKAEIYLIFVEEVSPLPPLIITFSNILFSVFFPCKANVPQFSLLNFWNLIGKLSVPWAKTWFLKIKLLFFFILNTVPGSMITGLLKTWVLSISIIPDNVIFSYCLFFLLNSFFIG